MVPIPGEQQRVEIQWIIKTRGAGSWSGDPARHDIPAGTLDHYWGDVATVVAQEASGGVNEVIRRQSGHSPSAVSNAAGSVQPVVKTQ